MSFTAACRLAVRAKLQFPRQAFASNIATRSFLSASLPRLEKQTIKVPSMGDSITEGTIVEWTTDVGQAVKEGDVVALVETDKVTVDIKAEIDGVVVKQFGAVDDTVEVGAPLYDIDTDAEATVSESFAVEDSTTTQSIGSPTPSTSTSDQPSMKAPELSSKSLQPVSRIPSIAFLGKNGWASRRSGKEHAPLAVTSPPSSIGAITLDGSNIPSNYGRPSFSETEMEALIMGGANLAPNVISTSSGAKFA